MKRLLLIGTALGAIVYGAPEAHAQIPVTDIALNSLTTYGLAKDAASWASQAESMATQINNLTSILSKAEGMYNIASNPQSLVSVAPSLLTDSIQSPLSNDMNATLDLASGIGRLQSTASNLAQQVESQNTFYLPPMNGSFVNTLMTLRANQTSGIQAQMQTLMHGISARVIGLTELQARINAGGDVNMMASLQARMQSEVAIAQSQGQQINALIGLAHMQDQIAQQQMTQKGSLDDNQFMSARVAATGGLVNFGSPTQTVPFNPTAATYTNVGSFSASGG